MSKGRHDEQTAIARPVVYMHQIWMQKKKIPHASDK